MNQSQNKKDDDKKDDDKKDDDKKDKHPVRTAAKEMFRDINTGGAKGAIFGAIHGAMEGAIWTPILTNTLGMWTTSEGTSTINHLLNAIQHIPDYLQHYSLKHTLQGIIIGVPLGSLFMAMRYISRGTSLYGLNNFYDLPKTKREYKDIPLPHEMRADFRSDQILSNIGSAGSKIPGLLASGASQGASVTGTTLNIINNSGGGSSPIGSSISGIAVGGTLGWLVGLLPTTPYSPNTSAIIGAIGGFTLFSGLLDYVFKQAVGKLTP